MSRHDALASRRAEAVLREKGLDDLPIDPFGIAASEGIEVVPKPTATLGISGMLLRDGEDFIIAYATHIDNEGFKRFAVSHELGHYFLAGHPEAVLGADGLHESRAEFVSHGRYEREADHFAAGLLMPRSLVKREIGRVGSGLGAVETLAAKCETSLTASAIRYAALADDPIAAVVSEGPRISYCFISELIEEAPGIQRIRKGEPLPSGTLTATFNGDRDRVATGQRAQGTASFLDWFGSGPDVEVNEDVVGLGGYGRTLTILTAQGWPDQDEDDEPDDYEPTFHRSRRR